jgi:hypothetical protein
MNLGAFGRIVVSHVVTEHNLETGHGRAPIQPLCMGVNSAQEIQLIENSLVVTTIHAQVQYSLIVLKKPCTLHVKIHN